MCKSLQNWQILVSFFIFFNLPAAVNGQTLGQNPGLPIPLPPPETPKLPTPPLLPAPDQLLKPPTPAPTPTPPLPPPTENIPLQIQVEQFNFEGNTAFSNAELAEVIKEYTGRKLTFEQLLQARRAITQHYVQAGYITTGALIPPQSLQAGIVTIQILEGELEEIKILGTQRLQPAYIRSRIELGVSKPLNVNHLLEALQNIQVNPLIESISAELATGSRSGSNILEVKIKEALTLKAEVSLDNGSAVGVGRFRRQIGATESNLLGWGDSLYLNYGNTDGSNTFNFRYSLPVNPQNGTITFSYSRSRNRIIESPFDELDIQSKSRSYELNYRQPLVHSLDQELALGLTLTRRENSTTLLGVPFPLSLGASETGETVINALRFSQDWTQRDSQQVFAARSQFSLGLGKAATRNQKPPDSRFLSWRGELQWLRQLAPDTVVILRGSMQLAERPLLTLEQLSLGGAENVRGYRQDTILSDYGVFTSAELRVPVYRLPDNQGILQLSSFVDFGAGWNHPNNIKIESNTLLSAGLGLRLQLTDFLNASLEYAFPLINTGTSSQESSLLFSLTASPF